MSDGKLALKDANVFELKSVIKNFKAKKSAFIEDTNSQLKLCLVGEDNELLIRRSHKENFLKLVDLKTVLWFKNAKKSIQDLCSHPSGSLLLAFCKSQINLNRDQFIHKNNFFQAMTIRCTQCH